MQIVAPLVETVHLPGDEPPPAPLCPECTHPVPVHAWRCRVVVGTADDPGPCPCPLTDLDLAPVPTLDEMLATGATYRQLDYWVRRGWLTPGRDRDSPRGAPGSGYARVWTERDRRVAALIVRLSESGLSVPAAARYAIDGVEKRVSSVTSLHNVTIAWRGAL